MISHKPINSKTFLKIFPLLDRRQGRYRCLVDGASWHWSEAVRKALPDWEDRLLRNVAD